MVERALGVMMAAQIRQALPPMVDGSRFLHDPIATETIKSQLLWHGAGRSWQDHVVQLTGSALRADALVQQTTLVDA